jgi:pimeloyl-ACP methyl ester carboxylesterase
MQNLPKLLVSICLFLPGCYLPQAADPARELMVLDECVILLHGIVRTSKSMNKMQASLLADGYTVTNWSYPSRSQSINVLAEEAIPGAIETCSDSSVQRINFVAHSMGAILIRYYLAEHEIENLGRIVMISPPNQGSELVDYLSRWPGFKSLNGPAGYQLGTDQNSLPLQLGPANFEVGIITGNNTTNPLFSLIIPGEDDGKVAVERARLEGMADFLVVPEAHSFIVRDDAVIRQSSHFLRYGHFNRGNGG